MFRVFGLLLFVNWATGENVVFEDTGRHRVSYGTTEIPVRPKPSSVGPNTIDNIFQIPIAVIKGTSAAAQSWYPENENMINKVFDIPVATLQAISNLVKDRLPQEPNKSTQPERNRRRRKVSDDFQEQDHQQNQQSSSENNKTQKRHVHGLLDWDFPLVDLFWGGHSSHNHGHHINEHKKKKRKPHGLHGSHGLGSHNHGHFFGNNHNNDNIGRPILGGDGNIYHVTDTLDDAIQIGPWKPFIGIQNKIAPGSPFKF